MCQVCGLVASVAATAFSKARNSSPVHDAMTWSDPVHLTHRIEDRVDKLSFSQRFVFNLLRWLQKFSQPTFLLPVLQ
jgi:hypothetical protein